MEVASTWIPRMGSEAMYMLLALIHHRSESTVLSFHQPIKYQNEPSITDSTGRAPVRLLCQSPSSLCFLVHIGPSGILLVQRHIDHIDQKKKHVVSGA